MDFYNLLLPTFHGWRLRYFIYNPKDITLVIKSWTHRSVNSIFQDGQYSLVANTFKCDQSSYRSLHRMLRFISICLNQKTIHVVLNAKILADNCQFSFSGLFINNLILENSKFNKVIAKNILYHRNPCYII